MLKLGSPMAPTHPAGGHTDCDTPCSVDPELGVLSHWLNRVILRYCAHSAPGKMDVDDLADHAVEVQQQYGIDRSREDIMIQLYHARLPILDEKGVVNFDDQNRTLRYNPDETLETLLEKIDSEE